MMSDPLKIYALVELRDQYTNVYPRSPSGARGWVREKRERRDTSPEVYIEWDKTHWRYHQERDGWAFEHHFRTVEDLIEPPPEISPDASPLDLRDILVKAQRRLEDERCPHCGGFHGDQDEYIDALAAAQDKALGGDGYLMITLNPRTEDGLTIYEPEITTGYLSDTAQEVIETQLIHMAAMLQYESAMKRMGDLGFRGEPG